MKRMAPLAAFGLAAAFCVLMASQAWAQKYGGVLRATLRGNPTSLSIHETASSDAVLSMSPVYNSLVNFDIFKPNESMETIVPELAESWAWSSDYTALTFKLHRGVKWHDGKPFTAADVKHTFDVVRGAKQSGMKLNPRKLWYTNVSEITTNGDHEVTFHLGRRQTSVLHMLAAGYSPIYPAHRRFSEVRTSAVGTGPFTLETYKRDQFVTVKKNPAYFVSGRPYLDGVRFNIIKGAATQIAALVSNQVDTGTINTVQYPQYLQLKESGANLVYHERVANTTYNVIVNFKKPPFNNPKIREAVNLSLYRPDLIRSFFQGGGVPGGALIPQPYGAWGLTQEDLKTLPGYGGTPHEEEVAKARKIMESLGYSREKPLKVVISTRSPSFYTGPATWMIGQLKDVWIEATLKTVETGNWYGMVARRDFQMGMNATAIGIDDPDANFYETYACGSQRNYSDYCNPELMKKVDRQSMETDLERRKALVREIDLQLQRELARPYLAYRKYWYPHYPYVKNWLPHISIYNGWRLQEVWLDK